ncbi:lipoprotein YdjY [Bacillaceae bacterium]
MRRWRKLGLLPSLLLLVCAAAALAGCSAGTTEGTGEEDFSRYYAQSEDELGEDRPIYIDKENKRVKVYATVNGKYLVEPTRHGLNWVEGAYGDQAVFKAYANPLAFNLALKEIGAAPAVDQGGDPSQEFEETAEGKFIKGDELKVTITWEGAGKEYDINEVMVDSTGKKLVYRFGGNYDAAKEKMTGCYMCFDSCPVGITSNASHPVDTFKDGKAEFHGNPDVLPGDGTPVVLTYALAQ